MANVPLDAAGKMGIIADIEPHELSPLAWSDGRNVRFRDGKIIRSKAASQVFGTVLGNPYWVKAIQTTTNAYWMYSSLTKMYLTDGGAHDEITRAVGGDYTTDQTRMWNGGVLGNIPVITNGIDVPQMFTAPAIGNNLADLSNWPGGDRVNVLKPFKSFLIGAALTRGGVLYPHVVKWSHPAATGTVPATWDETDPTKQAGEVEIVDDQPGQIRDGVALRDTFVLYKDNTVWGMQFIGGNSIFRFYPILTQTGILSNNCAVEIMNGTMHFVATGDDIILHDGQNTKSVLTKKLRQWLANNMAITNSDRSFCLCDKGNNEALFFFPSTGHVFPDTVIVYNYMEETLSIRNFTEEVRSGSVGNIGDTSDAWDLDTQVWDSDSTIWDLLTFNPHFFNIVVAGNTSNQLQKMNSDTLFGTAYLERKGLGISGQDRITGEIKVDITKRKIVTRIWPKVRKGPVKVALGAQEDLDGPLTYLPSQTYTPGVDKYLDFVIAGRLQAVRFDWDSGMQNESEIDGYDLEVSILGDL